MTLNSQRIVRDIVVIGGSAGGVEAVLALLRVLPADLPAVLALVLHRAAHPSALAEVLGRQANFPVHEALPKQTLGKTCLHVAPPDAHLIFAHGGLETSAGAKAHSSRPAIDPLFESAARAHGARVVGVVLSGSGSDGASGLQAIAREGGVTIVQDPTEAAVKFMPRAAISSARPDATLPLAEIAGAIDAMARALPYSFSSPSGPTG